MDSEEQDRTLFHKLVKKQRQTNVGGAEHMMFDGQLVRGEELPEAWATYFRKLATPVAYPEYDDEHFASVQLQNDLSKHLHTRLKTPPIVISSDQVQETVAKLKMGKAADLFGLSSEHLKYAHPSLFDILSSTLTKILETAEVPEPLKMGIITPIFKKKKSILDPDNYRRITITPIIGKVLEKLIVEPLKEILRPQISKLQRGFCEHSSSANTAFLLSEAIAEAKDQNVPLFAAFLDASKAFDVVWHAGMLSTLNRMGVSGNLWLLYCSLYQGMQSRVKCKDVLSYPFEELQGVRQGGIPSTELFKARGHQVLEDMELSSQGFSIGLIDVAAPTCADDMTLLADTAIGLQRLLKIAEIDAAMERYQYSKAKTKIMVFGKTAAVRPWSDEPPWVLQDSPLEVSKQETHLGLTRTPTDNISQMVDQNVKKARRSAYSLMSTGMYGMNGVHPEVGIKLWQTYALPVLLYGLEGRRLSVVDMEHLEKCQRQILRNVMHLPKTTAVPALHILSGVLPIKALLDKQSLSQFANFTRHATTKEAQIIQRQIAMKGPTSHSYVIHIKELLSLYDLPSVYDLCCNIPSKYTWKRMVRARVANHWTKTLLEQAELMSSLKYLHLKNLHIGVLHPVWRYCERRKIDILRASIKVKILVGRYYLEADHAKFTGGSTKCQLCDADIGDLQHFVLHCPNLSSVRDDTLQKIRRIAPTPHVDGERTESWLMQLIIDSSAIPECTVDLQTSREIEDLSRQLLFKLHQRRASLLV